jgi:glycine/D-amino acid oxidase-like deaminating enzyme/phosphoglycerate dehydrogenase-like enzyme
MDAGTRLGAKTDVRRVLVATPVTARLARLAAGAACMTLDAGLAAAPERLPDALASIRPHTLVVGANPVTAPAIESWTHAMHALGDTRPLTVVRRGTSLASIDVKAATNAGIDVVNTPDVNARHIAAFVVGHLLGLAAAGTARARPARDPAALTVGLIGAGNINGRVARAVADRGHRIVVFTPSLAGCAQTRPVWLRAHRLRPDAVDVAADVDGVFAAADVIGVAVPLTRGGPHPTRGLVDAGHVKAFSGTRIVSVAEPEVFTDAALLEAYARSDLDVVIDNARRLLDPVHRLVARARPPGGARPHEGGARGGSPPGVRAAPGRPGALRPGFTLSSAAMTTPGCAEDLDEAFLAAAAAADLAEQAERRPLPRRRESDPDPRVVVVGGGIAGLTVAFGLLTGGWSRLGVLDAAPADRGDPAAQGTTFASANGRHLSVTETLPHANPARTKALVLPPAAGGWRIRDPAALSPAERRWAQAFERRGDQGGLQALAAGLAGALNRLGLRGWETLAAADPDVFAGLRWDCRLTRAYLNAEDLAGGRALQQPVNSRLRELGGDDVTAAWPGLARDALGRAEGVHGALEVDGLAVNVHDVAEALRRSLVARGVRVRSGARVERVEVAGETVTLTLAEGPPVTADVAVVTAGGADLVALFGGDWAPASSVQGVLGVSVTVPNPGVNRPLKIHAPDPLGIINVTAAPDGASVHVSGGFGFAGLARAGDADAARGARELTRMLEDRLGRLFPGLRRPDGTLDVLDRRTCIRPMTPDGLPIVEALDRFDRRVIVAAGTNAGGTVQAPALAALVGGLLCGRPDVAHAALHGGRPSLGAAGGAPGGDAPLGVADATPASAAPPSPRRPAEPRRRPEPARPPQTPAPPPDVATASRPQPGRREHGRVIVEPPGHVIQEAPRHW